MLKISDFTTVWGSSRHNKAVDNAPMVKHMSSDMLPFGEGQKTSTVEVIRRSSDPLGIGPFDLTQKGLFTDLVTARLTARRLILGVTVLSVVVDVALAAIGVGTSNLNILEK